MSVAKSMDLRELVIQKFGAGFKNSEIAKMTGIHRNTISRYRKQWKRKGHLRPKKGWQKGYGHKLNLFDLKKAVQENPSATQQQLADKFGVARSVIWRGIKCIGFTYKKKH